MGPKKQQAFESIKWEIVCAAGLGPIKIGPAVRNTLYTTARKHGSPGASAENTWRYVKSTSRILKLEYRGVCATSEIVGTEAQLLLAP